MVKKYVLLRSLKEGDKFFVRKRNHFAKYELKKHYPELERALVENVVTKKRKFICLSKKVCFFKENHEKNDRKNNFFKVFSAIFLSLKNFKLKRRELFLWLK